MGTSRSAAEFSAKLARMGAEVAKLPREVESQNARTAETIVGAAVSAMSGGDGRLSRVRSGRGAPVGVKGIPRGDGTVLVTPRGPVWLVENPTEAHLIGAGRGRTTTRGGRSFVAGLTKSYSLDLGQPLNIGGGDNWVTGPVIHPGTKGAGLWRAARGQLPKAIVPNVQRAMVTTMRGVFG